MNRRTSWGSFRLACLALILAAGCTTSPAASAQVHPSPSLPVHVFAGGCEGTVLTDAEPPEWAQGGWHHPKGTPWSVPWAMGTPNDALAFVWGTELVAGTRPALNGSSNKVLWVAKDAEWGFVVEGHPRGKSQPVLTIAGGPSITDVPLPGCWTFRLSWGSNGQHSSTINLEVLPAGTLPH